MENIKIVRAHPEHLGKLVPLYSGYREFYEADSDPERETAFLKQRMENNESVIYLAENESGDGMGFFQLYPIFSSVMMQRVWLLNDLFVAKEHRNKGVAKALLKQAVEHGKNTGARSLLLETGVENFTAQKLYEKLGWERDEDHYVYYIDC